MGWPAAELLNKPISLGFQFNKFVFGISPPDWEIPAEGTDCIANTHCQLLFIIHIYILSYIVIILFFFFIIFWGFRQTINLIIWVVLIYSVELQCINMAGEVSVDHLAAQPSVPPAGGGATQVISAVMLH